MFLQIYAFQCDMKNNNTSWVQIDFRLPIAYGVRWGWQLCFCRLEQPGWWPHSCSSSQCRCRRAGWAGSYVWSPSSCRKAPPDDGGQRDWWMKGLQRRWTTATVRTLHECVCLEWDFYFRLTVVLAAPSTGRPSLSHSIIEGGLAPRDTQLRL